MPILTLQPNAAAGVDTHLREFNPTNNFGVTTSFSAGFDAGSSSKRRMLIKFDLSAMPTGALITSAILSLYCSTEVDPADFAIAAHRALTEWFEGTNNNAVPGGGINASTWNLRNTNGSVAWAGGVGGASGSDWAVSASDTVTITGASATYDWDVTADVQDFYSGAEVNYGWWMLNTTESGGTTTTKTFVSSDDSGSPADWPILTITYLSGDMSGTFAGVAAFSGAMPVQQMSGSTAGTSTFSGTMPVQQMSGSTAGVAVFSGHLIADYLIAGSFTGAATFTGAMPAQEMSGSFAGESTFTGGGRAVLLPRSQIWTAIIAGVEYALSGGNPFHRLSASGLGIPNIRNIKQRGPFQDGSTRRDFRLDERFLNLVFLLQGATCAQADTYRDTLIEIFKPLTDTPCQIRVTRDDGVIKQIDTYAVGVLDLPETEGERFVATQRVALQLEAPNPIWYGPSLQNLGFTSVLGGTEGFAVPIMIPWAQQPGEYINVTESFYYEGNWKEYPVIVVTGPAIDAKITNLTTNEKIDFTGHTIAAGDTRTIDLRFGTKTVKDAAGVLKNSELTTDSNLGTFHLEPSPGATGGINDIKVEILSGGTTATRVSLQYYNRYIHL